jgi:hypothetical protein
MQSWKQKAAGNRIQSSSAWGVLQQPRSIPNLQQPSLLRIAHGALPSQGQPGAEKRHHAGQLIQASLSSQQESSLAPNRSVALQMQALASRFASGVAEGGKPRGNFRLSGMLWPQALGRLSVGGLSAARNLADRIRRKQEQLHASARLQAMFKAEAQVCHPVLGYCNHCYMAQNSPWSLDREFIFGLFPGRYM